MPAVAVLARFVAAVGGQLIGLQGAVLQIDPTAEALHFMQQLLACRVRHGLAPKTTGGSAPRGREDHEVFSERGDFTFQQAKHKFFGRP
jgi:hypothetical protein